MMSLMSMMALNGIVASLRGFVLVLTVLAAMAIWGLLVLRAVYQLVARCTGLLLRLLFVSPSSRRPTPRDLPDTPPRKLEQRLHGTAQTIVGGVQDVEL